MAHTICALRSGRGEEIRTPGPMVPNHVRYQTALHPVAIIDKLLSFASRLTYNTIYFYICQEFFTTFFKIIFFYKFWQKPKQIKGFFDEKSIFHNNFYTYVIVFIKTASKIFHMPNFYKSYTTITTTALILYFLIRKINFKVCVVRNYLYSYLFNKQNLRFFNCT